MTTWQESPFALHLYATLVSPNPFPQPRQGKAKAAWPQSQGIGSRAWTPTPSIAPSLLGSGRATSAAGEANPVFESFCKDKERGGLIQGLHLTASCSLLV